MMHIKNRGSATLEACLAVPLFLFFLLAISGTFMLLLAEAHIHQSLAEAANYTAEYCYLEQKVLSDSGQTVESIVNSAILWRQFDNNLGDDFYVERMIENGKKGIFLMVEKDEENPNCFIAKAIYSGRCSIPIIGEFDIALSNQVKKKAFVGYGKEEKVDTYVYITPNQSVYHLRRNCTYLELSIQQKRGTQKSHYSPCGFCGKSGKKTDVIYVARTGDVYHYRRDCSGLKRTVSRVKLTEVGGLTACSRCGGS